MGVRYHANDFDPTGSIRAMSPTRRRQYVLAGILVVLGVLTLAILWNVAETVFFAITVAYVLYPARRRLVEYGIPRRVASGLVTAATFLVVVVLLAPIAVTLFRRRGAIVALLNDLPEMLPVELFGFAFVIDIGSLVDTTAATLRSVAISLAADSVFIVLQFGVFVLLLYGLLLRPRAVGQVSLEIATPTSSCSRSFRRSCSSSRSSDPASSPSDSRGTTC